MLDLRTEMDLKPKLPTVSAERRDAKPSHPNERRGAVKIRWVLASGVMLVAFTACSRSPDANDSGKTAPMPQAMAATPRGGDELAGAYVGVAACSECHPQRVEQFMTTRHYATSRVPELDRWPLVKSEQETSFTSRDGKLRFAMTRDEGGLRLTMTRDDATGESRRSEACALVFGAGAGDEVFHYARGRQLYQLPVAYLNPLSCWGNAPGFMDGAGDFDRPTPVRCMECHNTFVHTPPGGLNTFDLDHAVLGVTCERCHGPAGRHAAHHRSEPDDSTPRHIVRPAELSRDRILDICSQCHSNAITRRTAPFSFRPGDKLTEHFRVDAKHLPEADHTANQIEYLSQSRCFVEDASLTCVTCHDPHAADQADNFETSCRACHQAVDCKQHDALPDALRERCLDCHMPRRGAINVALDIGDDSYVPLLTRRDHRIAVHPNATRGVQAEWFAVQDDAEAKTKAKELASQIVQDQHQQAERYLQEYRYLQAILALRVALQWAGLAETDSESLHTELRDAISQRRAVDHGMRTALECIERKEWPRAEQELEAVLAIKPNLAAGHGKLGLVLAQRGRLNEAREHWLQVERLDPDSPYGLVLLGWSSYLERDYGEAVKHLARAAELDPYSDQVAFQYGLSLLADKQPRAAVASLRRGLQIQPARPEARIALTQALLQAGLVDDAVHEAREALHLGPYGLPLIMNAHAALQAANNEREAQEMLREAIAYARINAPTEVLRLETLLKP